MMDMISIAGAVWIFIMFLLAIYKLKVLKEKIELAYRLIKAQERRDLEDYKIKRAEGLDMALVILEGEFKWLERWLSE